MNFKKIKFDGDKVELHFTEYSKKSGLDDTVRLVSHDTPHPDFVHALTALRAHVVSVCELDDDTERRLTVRGVTITEKDTVVITALKELMDMDVPLVLNTPNHLPSYELHLAITALEAEAEAYVDGKRKQLSLFQEQEAAEVF